MIPAITSPTLANSIAINTHMNYAAYQDVVQVTALVKSLGVRMVRDGLHYWGNNDALNVLYSSLVGLGVNFNFVVDPSENLGPLTAPMLTEYDWLSERRIRYFEGPNEVDNWGGDWVATAKAFQQQLKEATTLAQGLSVGLIAPSLALTTNAAQLGDLTSLCDYGNLHAYPGGAPESFLQANPVFTQIKAVSGSKPVIVTECGYFTAGNGSVSELAQAKYILRMLLSYFHAGARMVFLYELLDQEPADTVTDSQLHFGLVRADGTEKPAFSALRNLISILRSGTESAETPLPASFTLPAGIESFLMQHSARGWLLALWQTASVYNGQDIQNNPVPLTLTFPAPMSVELFEPLFQAEMLSCGEKLTSITLEVPDHPVLVKISK